jgi:hypothetical protein
LLLSFLSSTKTHKENNARKQKIKKIETTFLLQTNKQTNIKRNKKIKKHKEIKIKSLVNFSSSTNQIIKCPHAYFAMLHQMTQIYICNSHPIDITKPKHNFIMQGNCTKTK